MSSNWEQKLIEDVVFEHVREQKRRRRWGYLFKFLIIALIVYGLIDMKVGQEPSITTKPDHVALVDINGVISAETPANADDIVADLRRAFESANAKAVMLRINSPGGSPVHAGYIFDEVQRLKRLNPEKKVYAVIMDTGASAAYYIAVAADEIYANRASVVGSIGVILPSFGFVDVMKKLGVEQRTQTSGEHKALLDPFSPINPDEQAFVQEVIDTVHRQFIQAVKEGRGERLDSDPEIFSGLFWTGEQALELGLIDGLGSAGFVAREVIGINDIYDYTSKPNWIDRFSQRLGARLHQEIRWSGLASGW